MRAELERILNGFSVRRLELIPQVRLERIGDAVAALCPALPELDFVNRIYGLDAAAELAPLEELYAAEGLRPWVELPDGEEPVGWERLEPVWVLAGAPAALSAESVREIGPGEAELFAETFCGGNGAPPSARPHVTRWAEEPGWRLYLAELDGAAAAAAALVVEDGLGLLAAASTLPAYRGRGCQTALIRRRIADSAAAGCREICALTASFVSRRNLERCGLELSYAKTAWRKL